MSACFAHPLPGEKHQNTHDSLGQLSRGMEIFHDNGTSKPRDAIASVLGSVFSSGRVPSLKNVEQLPEISWAAANL
jgi:hypothetical protein